MRTGLFALTTIVCMAGAARARVELGGARLSLERLPGQPVAGAAAPPAEPAPPLEADTPFTRAWTGGVELGLNGATGNTESINFRAGANARRLTDRNDTKADIAYSYARDDRGVSANRLEANARNDWLIPDSRWRFFGDARFEYDEFTDYDVRISAHGGVGYVFIKTDTDFLLGRAGVGAYKEFGSATNEIVPEGILGADYEHKFTETQSFTASVDFFPRLDDPGPYRADAKAAYQIVVDPTSKLTFKVGVEDRYNSTPGAGFKRNDLTYFALLSWAF